MTQQTMEKVQETVIITDEEIKYDSPTFDWEAIFDESGGNGDIPSSFQGI